MGGANCPETPRQKMIGMMYLVLTALLALNISKEILNAFVIVNEGQLKTNTNFRGKNAALFGEFEQQYALDKTKVGPYFDKAKQAKELTIGIIAYINNLKREVIAYTEFGDKSLKEQEVEDDEGIAKKYKVEEIPMHLFKSKDNFDKPMEILIGFKEDASGGKGNDLKKELDKYKTAMLNLIEDPTTRQSLNIGLETDPEFNNETHKKELWAFNTFEHTIMAADVVLLNKLIGEIRNAESDITSKLLESVTKKDFKFNKVIAKIIPKSNYVLQGDSYSADILVAAYSTTSSPHAEIITGDTLIKSLTQYQSASIKLDKAMDGLLKYEVPATTLGIQRYSGMMHVQKPDGTFDNFPFSSEYVVAQPTAIVAATKMNVFYIGVDNPVSISVPGVPDEKISPSISGCSLSKGAKGYTVKCTGGANKAVVSVSAELSGTKKSMGSQEFRVKRVPDPVPFIGGVKGGNVPKNVLLAGAAIIPQMENFDFELYFQVTSFSFSISVGGDIVSYKGTGNQLSPEMVKLVKNAKKGQKVYIEDIKATGAGSSRELAPMSLKIM